jgi:hypothetical protein
MTRGVVFVKDSTRLHHLVAADELNRCIINLQFLEESL